MENDINKRDTFDADKKKLKRKLGEIDYYELLLIYDFRKISERKIKERKSTENIDAEKSAVKEYADEFVKALMFCLTKSQNLNFSIFAGTREIMVIFTTTEQPTTNKYIKINDDDLCMKKTQLPDEIINSFTHERIGIGENSDIYILRENKILKWTRTQALDDAKFVFGRLYEDTKW